MKILFIGDYSNFHVTLADELRRRGHDATLASEGSGVMQTRRDIDLSRRPGLLGSFSYLGKVFGFLSRARDYDVVQIINPNFLTLRTGKLRYVFSELKRNNGAIYLSIAGLDPVIVRGCCEDCSLAYSEFRIGEESTPFARTRRFVERRWMAAQMGDHCRFIYDNVDGAMSALYEYDVLARPYLGDRLCYTGIPVDTRRILPEGSEEGDSFAGRPLDDGRKLAIFVGVKARYEQFKGLDRLYKAVCEVERRHPLLCEVTKVTDLPYEEYVKALAGADIVVDQLYSYTPATNALEAMARGQIAVSGGEEAYYDFIGETALRPIINVQPYSDEEIVSAIEQALTNPSHLRELSRQSREFVVRHNDVRLVADRFLRQWQKGRK